jgi:hypothetical protein
VPFPLGAEPLASVDEPGRGLVEPGLFRLMVGTSSADVPLQAELHLSGEPVVVERRSRYLTEVSIR